MERRFPSTVCERLCCFPPFVMGLLVVNGKLWAMLGLFFFKYVGRKWYGSARHSEPSGVVKAKPR